MAFILKEKMISYYKYLKTLNCMKMHNGVRIVNKLIGSLKAIKIDFNVLKWHLWVLNIDFSNGNINIFNNKITLPIFVCYFLCIFHKIGMSNSLNFLTIKIKINISNNFLTKNYCKEIKLFNTFRSDVLLMIHLFKE